MDLLLMGVVAKAHGLRGDLVVVPHNADSPLWAAGTVLALLPPERVAPGAKDRVDAEPVRTLKVVRARKQPDGRVAVQVDGVADRDQAEQLRGFHVAVDAASLPRPADDEVYHHELPGWAVVDTTGAARGVVLGVFSGPGGDLVEVDVGLADSVYIPFVAAIVKEIDRSARRLVIDPPEGLLEP